MSAANGQPPQRPGRVLVLPGGAEIRVRPDAFGGVICGGTYWWCRLSIGQARQWYQALGEVIAEAEAGDRIAQSEGRAATVRHRTREGKSQR